MSNRQDKPTSSPRPNGPMQAMAAVFGKIAEREGGMAAKRFQDLSKRALIKASEG
mgnify:CR=1 FL=1